MKNSIVISIFFIVGIITGTYNIDFELLYHKDLSLYVLYILLLLVGISIGYELKIVNTIKKFKWKIVLIPISCILGTYIGVLIYGLISNSISLTDLFAIGSGFGYYSLSSILISEKSGEILGTIALLSNILREITTLIFAPIIVRFFGKIAPIVSGGATSMDTTLPIVTKYSGKEYAILSVFNGVVLSILVPVLISFIYSVF